MEYYTLNILGLTRKLPLVAISPKIKIASFNLMGDGELVESLAEKLAESLRGLEFDYLVGPEVKVVPLIHSLAIKLGKPRYVILRKHIKGYMISPIAGKVRPNLVLNGSDAQLLKGGRVIIIDDVVSTGHTMNALHELMKEVDAKVIGSFAVLKQGEEALLNESKNLIYLSTIPLFKSP